MGVSRRVNKKRKKKENRPVGPVGLCLFGPKQKGKKKNRKGSVWFIIGFKSPLGVVGPFSKYNGSGYGPIILVGILGNFRRLGKHINIIRY